MLEVEEDAAAVRVPPVLVVADRLAVRPEETYLEQRFGSTYRDSRDAVRKWL